MKKRGLASLLIVSIIAIAAVFGVVFAFQNAGRETDVYGSATVTVDKPNIELEIELEKDTTADNKFRIVENELSSAYFTITVGGLPETVHRGVELNESSNSNGTVSVELVTPPDEAGRTGISTFLVKGLNGGAPTTLIFSTFGKQTVAVNVSVKMVAKDMKVDPSSHFGIRQGGDELDLMSSDVLNKFIFYAHPEDTERKYTPNDFPVVYRLKDEAMYPGVILRDGILSVTEDPTCVNKYIYLQAQLEGMTEWIDVPFYVFPKADNIIIKTNAYKASTTASNVWDLISNRMEYSNAKFDFALDCEKGVDSDYAFIVESADTQIVRVDAVDQYSRTMSTVQNLGEVAIRVTAYPIVKVGGKEIAYNDVTDNNVKVFDTFYLRVRNEFHTQEEAGIYGTESFHLTSNKETVNAFYYESNFFTESYFDTFNIDTYNGKNVNLDTNVEFELVVEDSAGGTMSGEYSWNPATSTQNISLYSILEIGYWSNQTNRWEMLSADNDKYYAHYLNRFRISFMRTALAERFLSPNMVLKLRVKSVSTLTNGKNATCEINLDATSVIDKFEVENLTHFDDGSVGVALVYDTKQQSFSQQSVDVYGKIAKPTVNGIKYEDSENWNTAKVFDNRNEIPFDITPTLKNFGSLHYLTYTITANNISAIEYYKDYPLTIEYPNGKKFTFIVRVYPTVESLTMSAISNSRGKIHKTITDNDDSDYEYVRTMYVRKGYTYELAVDTQGVSVGARAVFDRVYNESGEVVSNKTSEIFDACNLKEGLYECRVSLHAYSNDVYANNKRQDIVVYVIVVEPVGNVILPTNINFEGINDSKEVTLNITSLENKTITDNTYLHIEVAQPLNPNVIVEQGSKFNQFNITAKYLVNDVFNVGFKIYKSYNFSNEFDLDGQEWTENEAVVFNYIGGELVTTQVKIENLKPNKISVAEGVKTSDNIGNYLELVSGPGDVSESEIKVKISDKAKYQEYGIAYAQWKNGQFQLAPFVVASNSDLSIGDVAVARVGAQSGNIFVKPVADKTSMGVYALVIYACDSLRYVGVDNDANDLVLPDTYELVSLYIGSAEDIKATTDDLNSGVPHDANSGQINTRGSYNWVWKSQEAGTGNAILFYTPGVDNTNGFEANMYYVDDLYAVLGWQGLKNQPQIKLSKFVNNTLVGSPLTLKSTNGRLRIDLNREYNAGNEAFYSNTDTTVYFELSNNNGQTFKFYVVESLTYFDVLINSSTGKGLVARKNLNPNQYANAIDAVTVQRGNEFSFTSNLGLYTGWTLKSHNFDEAEQARTRSVAYDGGTYSFTPSIMIGGCEFDIDALQATVKVNVKGGVNYLNISQDYITLDGVTTATYDIAMRVDQELWSPELLTYNFLYEGVYYSLFEDGQTTSYINMEGGKAKLEFKLTCLNAGNPVRANLYYTYYLKIEVAIVVTVPDVDPFYNVSGARLFIAENLAGSPLNGMKTPATDSAGFNLNKQGIYNVTMAHFADTSVVEDNKSALILADGQTDTGVIYLDKSAGGLLVVYPTPYYVNVSNISLQTSQPHSEKVLIGNDLSGNPIYDTITYTIGFTQMVYNEDQKFYQPYISTSTMPQMISSWSKAEGYKWEGKYYFKTSIVSNSYFSHRLSDGTRFGISVSIQDENNAKAITEYMTIDARYRDSFVINPGDEVENFAVCTMRQTQYQALGTTAVYDVSLPEDCAPNYLGFIFDDVVATSKVVDSKYATVQIDPVAQTLSVYLKANLASIGTDLEIRIPYQRPGDYVNPYLSVVIVPVYFELDDLEVINHYETRLQVASRDELMKLQYRASFEYDTSMLTSSMSGKMNTFNNNLKNSKLLSFDYETPGQYTLEFCYTYVDGVPVVTKNSINRYSKTFYYDIIDAKPLAQRTEYLAVGTSATYTFPNWDPLHANKVYLEGSANNSAEIANLWDCNITTQDRNTVAITVSLVNKSNTISNNNAYEALVDAGKIVLNVFSTADKVNSQLELTIIPVYFTFDGFKLHNNPVNPIVALSTPTVITVEAGNINSVEDSNVASAINAFNTELLNAQNNLSNITSLAFSRKANDDGILNFSFDSNNRSLKRSDTASPITATSYLLVSAGITYVNGVPTLDSKGERVLTYLPVTTYGEDVGNNDDLTPDLETAPNGRTRTVAQAIGTSVRYNIALSGVAYDARLDKYEVRADGNHAWDKNCGWNAIFNVKESTVAVTLNVNTGLFDKTLTILAYSRQGELMYILNIVPAYFTVEQILLADHIDENPVMIKDEANWLNKLNLDFKTNYFSGISNFDFEGQIKEFKNTLNTSSLVSRIDDAGYVTLFAGVNYEGGIPTLANLVNAKTSVQSVYRYDLFDGIPENTKAQALGTEIVYNVNRTVGLLKISTGVDAEGKDVWEDYNQASYPNWWVQNVNQRCIKIGLTENTALVGQVIRIGVFVNPEDEEAAYILNIVPAYFTVEDLTVAGQSVEDRDIFLYYGEEYDSPLDVIYDAIYGEYSKNSELNVASKMGDFKSELQDTKADLIVREYDANAMSGNLHVTVYLDYESGVPTIVAETAQSPFVARVDVDFNYTVYGKGSSNEQFPPMPSTPRTRTEIQAVGTTASYVIDLNKNLSLDVDYLTYDDAKLSQRGWKLNFEDNILTVELLNDATTLLANGDIVIEFYVGYEVVFVFTIQPVLFEVVGLETAYPEQPVRVTDESLAYVMYRVVAKYNDQVTFQGENVITYIEALNTKLNQAKGSLLEAEIVDSQYLKIDAAFDYGISGSVLRTVPALLNVENYPLQTVESYVKIVSSGKSQSATHNQAVGTTEYYHLGLDFNESTVSAITIDGNPVDDAVVATVVPYVGTYALKVVMKPDASLVGKDVVITVGDFTMTIKGVWFLVEGFDVINHPERHMWLINSEERKEDVDDLMLRVRARYSLAGDESFQTRLQAQIDLFNQGLATYSEGQWTAGEWAQYLETYTIGGSYFVVRAGVEYNNGVASIIDIAEADQTLVVRDVFEYARYSDKVASTGLVRPNIPRSRIVELTIGHSAVYTIDFPELEMGFTDALIALYENDDVADMEDDSKLTQYTNGSDGWQVNVIGKNQLQVELAPDAKLVNRELKVFIYYEKSHVSDKPDSYDMENVAFILTIRPVWFKVVGIALNGYPDDEIYVDSINEFMADLANMSSNVNFVPVFEYSDDVLSQLTVGTELQKKMDDFVKDFKSSPLVTKTRVRENTTTYHFQVTTSVTYTPYTGVAVLADETTHRLWESFKVVVDADAEQVEERVEYQAIGTSKTYYIDSTILENVESIEDGANYTVTWDKDQTNKNYVVVTLDNDVTVDTVVDVAIGDKLVLKIKPVYYEILGFETVEHPERAVWVISPYTTEDLKYRAITTELSNALSAEILAQVQESIDNLNLSVNSGSAPVSIEKDGSQNIIFNAGIDYEDGYPKIVEITKDKRNVVESIIPYRIWSANIKPNPEHPSVVGTTESRQVIGGTKVYTLKKIRGQVFYQHLWVENAGELLTSFADSANGTTQVYEGLSILVDPVRNTLKVQITADARYLANNIRIYLPYLTSVNGKDVWYSHCIDITPLLFDLQGWTITASDPVAAENQLVPHEDNDQYLLLTRFSNPSTIFKYVAKINYYVTDASLLSQIEIAKTNLENLAVNYITPVVTTDYIKFNNLALQRLVEATQETDSIVGLSSYIIYENGVPKLVESSKNLISNQILISTGYDVASWNPNVQLGTSNQYVVQAIGTVATYEINIAGAGKIFDNQVKAVDKNGNAISIVGEQSNLVMVESEDCGAGSAVVQVSLAPVIALRNIGDIEIRIPYSENPDAETPDKCYILPITPVIFIVEGFYLEGVEDNNLLLQNKDIPLVLRVNATYSEDVNMRNMVNYLLKDFESRLNQSIQSDLIEFTITNNVGGNNVEILKQNKKLWIHQKDNESAVDVIATQLKVGYNAGIPQLLGTEEQINVLTDALFNYKLTVSTAQGIYANFPGWNGLTEGQISPTKYLQAVGTSRSYPISIDDPNISFYHQFIKVFNGGPQNGANEYEYFALEIENPGFQSLTINFSLRATARTLNDWIDIRVPYTVNTNEGSTWYYYSLKIKPVLFEIKSWKLKVYDELRDEITLDDHSVELRFAPEIFSGPLDLSHYTAQELTYIKSAINRLEIEINTYDPLKSDGYTFMVIDNMPQEGYQVNYTVFRDNSTNKSYTVRDSKQSSTTTVRLSANVAYNVSDASKEYVEGAQAVTEYLNSEDAHLVEGIISIHTSDLTVKETGDRSTVFITQENANQLTALRNGVDYVLMSDIYLDEIASLNNGRWKPVAFPTDTTLDGNNFRIYINSAGFDLSAGPTNIGLFTEIPTGSVVKNVQIVFEQEKDITKNTELKIDLTNYTTGQAVNIGLLAGVNNGIVSNCAVLSDWQFNMRNITAVKNPVTADPDDYFKEILPFNAQGYVFDDQYFYKIELVGEEYKVTQVYDEHGYGFKMTKDYEIAINEATGKPFIEYDDYYNVVNWITPDRTIVANYETYSPIMFDEFDNSTEEKQYINAKSAAKLYVYANNDKLSVVLGGLVGANNYMVTNSRVLIDVELYGPEKSTEAGHKDEVSVKDSVVGGFAGVNAGTITTSFFRDGSVVNNANANVDPNATEEKKNESLLGGFVGRNSGTIQQSYAMGCSVNPEITTNNISVAGAVKTIRNSLGGFVHVNSGTIIDCMVNMVINKSGTDGYAGGFVYQNTATGKISNCVENNNIIVQSGSTLDYYAPFVVINGNGTKKPDKVVTTNLSNLIYAGNASGVSFSDDWIKKGVLKNLTVSGLNDITNYESFSIGKNNTENVVSAKNTIWKMTEKGPALRGANDIAISYRKYAWNSSPYLYNPGTEKNPYLIWNAEQFNKYIYSATAHATTADKGTTQEILSDIENNRQSNHLRLIDNITLDGIKDTYKIIYTGTMEGNGLTMSGISSETAASSLATMGLFGKAEYATFRNINFEVGTINSTARYVGGIAGIAINTSFVDVKVNSLQNSNFIKGANIVGGFVGLNVVNDPTVEYYNLHSSVSATANFQSGQTDVSAQFTSGTEYVQQTLYSRLKPFDTTYEQGFGTAGAVFGFITSNPNNYRTFDNGKEVIKQRTFTKEIKKTDPSGNIIYDVAEPSSLNTEQTWFLKDRAGNAELGENIYYRNQIILRNISGAVNNITANVAGGLIGIMDETIELHKPSLTSLKSLTGKYFLGGLVGINLGKIAGETSENDKGETITYEAFNLSSWTVASSAGTSYVFRSTNDVNKAQYFWGMSVGAVAGYNDGLQDNLNSGVIENIHVNANVLAPTDGVKMYAIGGVVGANGNYGSVINAVNNNTNVKNDNVRVVNAQGSKVGYYFGQIIGRSSSASSTLTSGNNTRMVVMQMEFPANFTNSASYVSVANFGEPNSVANHFKVPNDKTLKLQTFTEEEYYNYLAKTITSQDLPTRISLLERLVRSLPTTVTTATINKKLVRVEKFDEARKQKLIDWAEANKVFEIWDYSHKDLEKNVIDDFKAYLEYSAVSDIPASEEDENAFNKKLATYRNKRSANAMEFFTYQYQIKTADTIVNGKNAKFNWNQYENYLRFKEIVLSKAYLKLDNYDLFDLENMYGYDVAGLLYVSNNTFVEFKDYEIENVYDHQIFRDMVDTYKAETDRYTNKDPLQVYINYIAVPEDFTINNMKMSLAQQYYYMAKVYGETYKYESASYTVPKDLPEAGNSGYASYVYLNGEIDNKMSIGEFIYMIKNESKIVEQNETAWLKTGHLGAGGARISDIGAVTLDWATPETWTDEGKALVQANSGVIKYGETGYSWAALANYNTAKAERGLTIAKYKEIVALGGSLHTLITSQDYRQKDGSGTERYIFALKSEQYNWTAKQNSYIMANYEDGNTYDLQYALAATTYGNIIDPNRSGSVRAVYVTNAQILVGNTWIADNNGNGDHDAGESLGAWYFPGNIADTTIFTNGDGQKYYSAKNGDLHLSAQGTVGAAMYLDRDEKGGVGDKMFGTAASSAENATRSAGSDILILYPVATKDEADFYQKDDQGNITGYFKIARQIIENDINNTIGVTESTDNHSDYLEEARWWRSQGFTAEEFDKIKVHTMMNGIPEHTGLNSEGTGRLNPGFTVADDWYANWNGDQESGFKMDNFTPSEYTEIVLGANYVTVNGKEKWYSTYADYLLFVQLYNAPSTGIISLNSSEITKKLPSSSLFNNPLPVDDWGDDMSLSFIPYIISENVLSDAMDFNSEREAFMDMFRAEGSTAGYVIWARDEFACNVDIENKFFRLNHYIYYIQNDLDEDENFDGEDLEWTLTQDIRADIYYHGVTQEDRTTDLVEYRRNWYNDGDPFITFRDYCEWINIYAYDDVYRVDRGDVEDAETGETIQSTDGWLTIEAFAVWKRMEKYENNVEYIAKSNENTPYQSAITAPILKRKISTTVFPKIHSSGNQTVDSDTGMVTNDRYILPNLKDTGNGTWFGRINGWYDADYKPYTEYSNLVPDHLRETIDRFEYNENYNTYEIDRYYTYTKSTREDPDRNEVYRIATYFINDSNNDSKFAKPCNKDCGGLSLATNCNDRTHAANIIVRWIDRYGWNMDHDEVVGGYKDRYTREDFPGKVVSQGNCAWPLQNWCKITFDDGDKVSALNKDLPFLERFYMEATPTGNRIKIEDLPAINDLLWDKWKDMVVGADLVQEPYYAWDHKYNLCLDENGHPRNTNNYNQLYVPYNTFKSACQQIKSVYSAKPEGYFNYMKYWARNGDYRWICDITDYPIKPSETSGWKIVNNTYMAANFWYNYKGTQDPVTGKYYKDLDGYSDDYKANGW